MIVAASTGMAFALNDISVDAMIERHPVVTLGVRERMVKPATEFADSFAMGRIKPLLFDQGASRRDTLLRAVSASILSLAASVLVPWSAQAGSTSALFQVAAQVVNSCKISSGALMQKATGADGTVTVSCQSTAPSMTAATGTALPSATANVNCRVDDMPGTDGAVKIVTVNY